MPGMCELLVSTWKADMMKHSSGKLANSGGTMGENRAGTREVRVPGCINSKRLRGVGSHGTPQMPNSTPNTSVKIGDSFNLLQLNIEGATRSKMEVLYKIAKQHDIDAIALQETHHTTARLNILTIPEYTLVTEKAHAKYGLATFVKNDLITDTKPLDIDADDFSISIQVNTLTITNVYKTTRRTMVIPGPTRPATSGCLSKGL